MENDTRIEDLKKLIQDAIDQCPEPERPELEQRRAQVESWEGNLNYPAHLALLAWDATGKCSEPKLTEFRKRYGQILPMPDPQVDPWAQFRDPDTGVAVIPAATIPDRSS